MTYFRVVFGDQAQIIHGIPDGGQGCLDANLRLPLRFTLHGPASGTAAMQSTSTRAPSARPEVAKALLAG